MVDSSGKKTDLSPLMSYGSAWQSTIGGGNTGSGWFGPLAPMLPTAPPEVAGRQFDYRPGVNLLTTPRSYEAVSFEMLRHLADSYDLMRLIIETRKDQLDRITLLFRPMKGKSVSDARVKTVNDFFKKPDGEHNFRAWLRMLLEDLLVIDALTLYKQRDRSGKLIALYPLDGATIKRVVDDWGRTPMPYKNEAGSLIVPPAYQQVLKGMPAVDYSYNDIIYRPRNVRTHKLYGYSPVEQVIMTVNIALRRELGTLDYYTEGNIPSALIGVPDTWTPDQIRQFQDYWDLYFTGDLAARRRAKFVPGGVAKTFIATKEPELKNSFDEWLAKILCFAFSISPQALVSQVNRATANTQKEQAEEEGLVPLIMYIRDILNDIIQNDLGEPDIECAVGDDEQSDSAQEATVLNGYVDRAVMTRNEAREKLGLDPSPLPEADELGFTTATGFVYLDTKASLDTQKKQATIQSAAVSGVKSPKVSDSDKGSGSDKSVDKFEKYTPEEARDEHGRWTSDGSSDVVPPEPVSESSEGVWSKVGHVITHGATSLWDAVIDTVMENKLQSVFTGSLAVIILGPKILRQASKLSSFISHLKNTPAAPSTGSPQSDRLRQISSQIESRSAEIQAAERSAGVSSSQRLPEEFNPEVWKTILGDIRNVSTKTSTLEMSADESGVVTLFARMKTEDGKTIGQFERRVDLKNGVMYADQLDLKPEYQRTGLAGDIIRNMVDIAQYAGISRIQTTANHSVGGYAWAKYGYVPSSERGWDIVKKAFIIPRLGLPPASYGGEHFP